MNIFRMGFFFLRAFLLGSGRMALENLALRQQLAVFHQSQPRPKLHGRDRLFWVVLSKCWASWRSALVIVSPDTVVRWHRQGFRYYWAWKSRRRSGREAIPLELRRLIRRMSRENPLWGAPRIRAELRLLGHDVAQATVAKYMDRKSKPPSPTWKTFLRNHLGNMASMDFFVVPTVTFQVLYVFIVLRHERRQVVHFNVTQHPTAEWVSRQLLQAFPFDTAPRYLIRDRDGSYGEEVCRTIKNLGSEEVVTAPHINWTRPLSNGCRTTTSA